MVSKQFVDMDADFDSDDSGDPHGDFLALVNKQLLIERETEKILEFMKGGTDDIGTEADRAADTDSQHDGTSHGHTDTFSNNVYKLNTVIKTEKDADEDIPWRKSCQDVPISVGNSVLQSPAPVFYSQSTQNYLGTAKVKTEPRDLPKVSSPYSEACSQKLALSSSNPVRKGCTTNLHIRGCTHLPISVVNSLPQAPVFAHSQSTQNTLEASQIKVEERGSQNVNIPHSVSPSTTSSKVALISSTSTSVAQQAGGQKPVSSTPRNCIKPVVFSTRHMNGLTTVYPSSGPPAIATQIIKMTSKDISKLNNITPQLLPVPSSNAVSGSTTQIPPVIQGQTVQNLSPGYQVLPQMTWQSLPIMGQPYAGVINNLTVANSQPQNIQQLSSASTVLSNGSRPLPSWAVSSSSSATTGSSTQPIQATPLYHMIPIVQQPIVINPVTANTQATQQTKTATPQSRNTTLPSSTLNPVDVQSNGLLTQTVSSQSSGSFLQPIQPNFMNFGQVIKIPVPNSFSLQPNSLLPQSSGLNVASLQSNGLIYQIPQLNLANNVTLQAQQANLGNLQSNSTILQTPLQLNQASLQSNSLVLQSSQSDITSLQSNSSGAPQPAGNANSTLVSLRQILSLLQQNIQQSPSTLNTQTQQNTAQGMPKVVNLSGGPSSNVFTNRHQILAALNDQIQQNTAQLLGNVVNPSSAGATPNIQQTSSTLKTQTQHNTAQELPKIVIPISDGASPAEFTNHQQVRSTLNNQIQQNTEQAVQYQGSFSRCEQPGQILKPICDLMMASSEAPPLPVPQLPVLNVLPGGMKSPIQADVLQEVIDSTGITGSVTGTQRRGRKRSAPAAQPGPFKFMKILPKPGDDANASSC